MKRKLDRVEQERLIEILRGRFAAHMMRHESVEWVAVEAMLLKNHEALAVLHNMEVTGGEPDLVRIDSDGSLVFMDCAIETPKGRRNCCYDEAARVGRKKFPPEIDAVSVAKEIGAELLDESDYRYLQTLGAFDLKTSSWIVTPSTVRNHGGALFCDRRYDMVFVYHNGADSYYGARGFRVKLNIK